MLREARRAEVTGAAPEAPLVLRRARLWDRAGTWTIALRDGRIDAIIPERATGKGLDLNGLVLVPGFHDPHVHLLAMAREREVVRLADDLRGPLALRRALWEAQGDAAPETWLRVRGFDHDAMTGGWIPDRAWLDEISGDRPVRIQHRNLRLDLLNSAALRRTRLDGPRERPGLERGPDGIVTGRVFQNPGLVEDPDGGVNTELVADVSRELLAHGVTSVQDAGAYNGQSTLDQLHELAANGSLRQRLWSMVSAHVLLRGEIGELGPRVRHAKLMPIEERLDLDELVESALVARRHGLGLAIHATTETELAAAVAILEAAPTTDVRSAPPSIDRIEHAAVSTPELVAAVARIGATVVANPSLVTDAGDSYLDRHHADDVPHLHRLRTWCEAGVPLALASDAPVTSCDPHALISAAVTRTTASGQAFATSEALDVSAAIGAATVEPARLVGAELRLGRIAPGFAADLVALRPGPDGLLTSAGVALTILAGEVVHAAL